jgi:ribosome maturation factor RimP
MKIGRYDIENLITPIVEAMGYVVWHIELFSINRKTLLRIFVDLPPGDVRKSIDVDDCGVISKQIGGVIDVEEIFPGSYLLEVSSPGLDRGLFIPAHYKRFIGSKAHVILRESITHNLHERRDFSGRIKEVDDNSLHLEVDDKIICIDITNINRAKLIPDL